MFWLQNRIDQSEQSYRILFVLSFYHFFLYYYIDKEIKAKLAPYAAMVHAAEKEIVGETSKTLHFEECVSGECALGDLLVDAMTEYVRFSNIIHTETNGKSMS